MSLVEAGVNIAIGYASSLIIWSYVISPVFHVDTSSSQDIGIVTAFTFVSLLRQYFVRRFFATRIHQLAEYLSRVSS